MEMTFEQLWRAYIMPLEGQEIMTADQSMKNKISRVTDKYLTRISSKGIESSKFKKELFAEIYDRLKKEGTISRMQINTDYQGRRSSIVTVILGVLPNVTVKTSPVRLVYDEN